MSKNLIFLHIPKAAGSTLRAIIRRQYADRQVYHVSSIPNLQKSIDEFKSLPESKREKVRFLTGHGVFGLHSHLVGSAEYVTMFREPVSRVISNYYYVRRSPEHRLYEEVTEREMSLREYVTSGVNKALDNQMVRDVAGENREGADADMLQQAKENLDQFFGVVGLVERFDESVLLMKRRFGWKDVSYRKRNVTHSKPGKEDIPDEIFREIERRNRLDIKLYEYAKERLNKSLRQIDLKWELRTLRFQCRMCTLKAEIKGKVRRGLATIGLR